MPVARVNPKKLIDEDIILDCVGRLRAGADVSQDTIEKLDDERIKNKKEIIIEGYPLEQLFAIAYGNAMYALQIFRNKKFHRYFTKYQQAENNIWSDETLNLNTYIHNIRKRYRRSLMLLDNFENNIDSQYLQSKGKTFQKDTDTLLSKYVLQLESSTRATQSYTAQSNLFYLLYKQPELTIQSIYTAISAEKDSAVALADKNYKKLKVLSETATDINDLMVNTIEKQMSDNSLNQKTMAVFVNIGNLALINEMLNPNIFYRVGKKIFKNIFTLGFSNNTDTLQTYVNAKDIIARISAEFATPESDDVNIEQKLKLIATFLERRFIVGTDYWREADDDCWKTLFQILPNIQHDKKDELHQLAKERFAVVRKTSIDRVDREISNLLNPRPAEHPASDLVVNEIVHERRLLAENSSQHQSSLAPLLARQQQTISKSPDDVLLNNKRNTESDLVADEENEDGHEEEREERYDDIYDEEHEESQDEASEVEVVNGQNAAILPAEMTRSHQTSLNQLGHNSAPSRASTKTSVRVSGASLSADPYRSPKPGAHLAHIRPRALFQSPLSGQPALSSVGTDLLFKQDHEHVNDGHSAQEADSLNGGSFSLFRSPTLVTRVNEESDEEAGDDEGLIQEQLPYDESLNDDVILQSNDPDPAVKTGNRTEFLSPTPLGALASPALKHSAKSSPASHSGQIPAAAVTSATPQPTADNEDLMQQIAVEEDEVMAPPQPQSLAAATTLQEHKPDDARLSRINGKSRTPKPMSALNTPSLNKSGKPSPKSSNGQVFSSAPQPFVIMLPPDEVDAPVINNGTAPLATRVAEEELQDNKPYDESLNADVILQSNDPDPAVKTGNRTKFSSPAPLGALASPAIKRSAKSSPASHSGQIPAAAVTTATPQPIADNEDLGQQITVEEDEVMALPQPQSLAATTLQEHKPDAARLSRINGKSRTPKPMSAQATPTLKKSPKASPKSQDAQIISNAPQQLVTKLPDDEFDAPVLNNDVAPSEIQQPPVLTTRLGDDELEDQGTTTNIPLKTKLDDEDDQEGEVIEFNQDTDEDDLPYADLTPVSKNKLQKMEEKAKEKAIKAQQAPDDYYDENEIQLNTAIYEGSPYKGSPSLPNSRRELSPTTNGQVSNFLSRLHTTLQDSEMPRSPARLMGSAKRKGAPLITRLDDSPEFTMQPLSTRVNDSIGSRGSRRSPDSSPLVPVAPKPLATRLDDSLEEGIVPPESIVPALPSGLKTRLEDLDEDESTNNAPPAPLVMRILDDEQESEEDMSQSESATASSETSNLRKPR